MALCRKLCFVAFLLICGFACQEVLDFAFWKGQAQTYTHYEPRAMRTAMASAQRFDGG